MTKYTTNKIFDKHFPLKIWKIAVDSQLGHIAIELRDPETTNPYLHVLDFQGNSLLTHLPISEKTWTLDNIRQNTLILKTVGENVPVKEGILLIDMQGNEQLYLPDYVLLDTYQQHLKIRHRSFQSGFEKYIPLSGEKQFTIQQEGVTIYDESLIAPLPYPYTSPPHLHEKEIQGTLWFSQVNNKVLWSYHTLHDETYSLNLCITDQSNVLIEHPLITGMPKMLPQPYFQVRDQFFLMSYNKQEIVSYLV